MKSVIRFAPTLFLLSVLSIVACQEAPTNPVSDGSPVELKPGKGKGGGGGSGTPLMVTLAAMDVSHDGNPVYADGSNGVTAEINADGYLGFSVSGPRAVFIGPILAADGGAEVEESPGLVEADFISFSCCDFRAMSAVKGSVTETVIPNDFKLLLSWDDGNVTYKLSYGSRKCVPGNDPVGYPAINQRGTRVEVMRDPGLNMPSTGDTTWTVQSVGPAVFCKSFDNRGVRNDTTTTPVPVDVALRMVLTQPE